MATQFTIRLKNEPGALADLAGKLGEHSIDIRNIGAGGVGTYALAVLITNNDDAAREVLRQEKYTFVEGEVLHIGVEDHPGSLAALTRRLANAGVNINGVAVLGRRQGKAELAISVDAADFDRARRVLVSSPVTAPST
jgi:hypothetical protein